MYVKQMWADGCSANLEQKEIEKHADFFQGTFCNGAYLILFRDKKTQVIIFHLVRLFNSYIQQKLSEESSTLKSAPFKHYNSIICKLQFILCN